jgi:hypothetical protein
MTRPPLTGSPLPRSTGRRAFGGRYDKPHLAAFGYHACACLYVGAAVEFHLVHKQGEHRQALGGALAEAAC